MKDDLDKKSDLDKLVNKAFIVNENEQPPESNAVTKTKDPESIKSALNQLPEPNKIQKKNKPSIKKQKVQNESINELIEEIRPPVSQKTISSSKESESKADLTEVLKQNESSENKAKKSKSRNFKNQPDTDKKSVNNLSDSTWKNRPNSTIKENIAQTSLTPKVHIQRFIFSLKGLAIILITVTFTLSIIYYMTSDLMMILHKKSTPYDLLKNIDSELISYQKEKSTLPESLEILIAFPENAVHWPMKYKSVRNIEGKTEIFITRKNEIDYTLYLRKDSMILEKPKGLPARKIEKIP